MAAPVSASYHSYSFRDSKGEVVRLRVLIGGASTSAVATNAAALKALFQAASNANVYEAAADGPVRTYGTTAQFADTEDKAKLTFADPAGYLHRYELPAPKVAGFYTDLETVLASDTNISAVKAAFESYVYGRATDTAPLVYLGGVRIRRRTHRRLNILIKDPTITEPAE